MCMRAKAYRCRLDLCKRRWLTSGALFRYGRKTLETVLGEHIDAALGDYCALREEGVQVWLKIL